ncbi:MAG: formylglycine-generating enzyme family protein [Kiritimatiellae bacterium]|nr:formylglycine-generating enzyme family protein [Kiritimatiellia bacterium]
MKARMLFGLLLCAGATAFGDPASGVPKVTDVTMTQAASRLVTIGYRLTDAPAIVTLDIQTNATDGSWASIGGENIWSLSGDANKKVSGKDEYTINWRPDISWPDHKIADGGARAVVTAWALDNPPDYMVVDISDNAGNVEWYPSADFLPGGLLGDDRYRQSTIVMRKIAARDVTFTVGSIGEYNRNDARERTHAATLTNNFYIGVFEVTQAQWSRIFTSRPWPSYFTNDTCRAMRPVEQICFNEVRRGGTSSSTGGEWPAPPGDGSFLKLLRDKTGIDFDLPSETQWEYVCRAGNGEGRWGNGTAVEGGAATPGRCTSTGGSDSDARNVTAEKGTAVVGTYPPNDWGIYDMHGNIQEFCLDYFMDDPTPLRGAVNTTVNAGGHIVRGGCFVQSWACIRSAWRSYNKDSYQPKHFGVRLVCGMAK